MTSRPFMCCSSFIPRSSCYLVSLQRIHVELAQSDRAELSTSGRMFLFGAAIGANFAQVGQPLNFKALVDVAFATDWCPCKEAAVKGSPQPHPCHCLC